MKATVSNFFKDEFVDYASYSTIRMIASSIDGLKNVNRKIIRTIIDKKIVNDKKVSQLNSIAAEYCEYLHGDMSDSISKMAQSYAGSNNLPLLAEEGSFGNRFINKPSAPRYIFTYGKPVTFSMFNASDNRVLTPQYFEGTEIEPAFYLPSLPMLLINGSNGISSGFKQTILGRNPESVKKFLVNKLEGAKTKFTSKPYFKGFKGTVVEGDELGKWVIQGKIKRHNTTTIEVLDIPVGIELGKYIQTLESLLDKKIIMSYTDNSDKNVFNFTVKFRRADIVNLTDDEVLDMLKLKLKVSETYTALDENLKIKVFNNVDEIFSYYYSIKLKYLDTRKQLEIKTLNEQVALHKSKWTFINMIVEDELIVNKRTKIQIINDIKAVNDIIEKDGSYDYLLNMTISQLTKENLTKLKKMITESNKTLRLLKKKTVNDIWLDDLETINVTR